MQKDLEKAVDVKKSLFDLTVRHEEMQTFFYEQSRTLVSKNQEIAMLKLEANNRQTMKETIFAKEYAERRERLRLEQSGKLGDDDSLGNSNHSSHGNPSSHGRPSSAVSRTSKYD